MCLLVDHSSFWKIWLKEHHEIITDIYIIILVIIVSVIIMILLNSLITFQVSRFRLVYSYTKYILLTLNNELNE